MGFEKGQKETASQNSHNFQVGDHVAAVWEDENNTENWYLGVEDHCDYATLARYKQQQVMSLFTRS